MKKFNYLIVLFLSLLTWQGYQGQNVTLNPCSSGIAQNTYLMASTTTAPNYNRSATIVTAGQLSALNGGDITNIFFRRFAATGTLPAGNNFKVYMKLTAAADFGSSAITWATEIASATLVYDGDPSAIVGSDAGYKNFPLIAPFTYTTGSNIAFFYEYSQTVAPATTISWDYEYGTTCTGSNNNTGKYTVSAAGLPATLATSNYRRPLLAFQVNFPPANAAPACTTLSTPANNATGISVTPTFNWASVGGQNGATTYLINLGTTPGGTDIMNGVDVGNVTTYTVSTALNFLTAYYVTILPKNGIGTATGCTETKFTTSNITCPVVTAPATAATGVSTTPSITWNASAGATGYKITMGTTSGGTDILNAVDVGNVLTYTFATPLMQNTTYYYTINSYSGAVSSASCTIRNFTTACGALTPNYTNDFATFPGACWSQASGGTAATGSTGSTLYWAADGFLNSGTTGAAKMNIYSTARIGWLKSPSFDLSAGGYRVNFNYGLTAFAGTGASTFGSDDMVQFLVSTDGGTTWTVLQTWDASTPVSNTSNLYSVNLAAYTGANTMFAIYGSSGTVSDSQDFEFFVDNFIVETIPSCLGPVSPMNSGATTSSLSYTWTAPTPAPANGYQVFYSTTNTAPLPTVVLTGSNSVTSATTSATISGLTSDTTYYVWVRSDCGATQGNWISAGSANTGYCAVSTTGQASWIASFTSTGASTNMNYTSAAAASATGYANLTATNKISNFANSSTSISLTAGGPTTGFAIWVDWNNNLIFEASEKVFGTTGYVTTTTGTIMVPTTAAIGNYRMRTVVDWNTSTITNPCAIVTRGEYIDYTFEVVAPPSCAPVSAITASNITTTTADLSWTAPATAPGIGYDVFYSMTNTAPTGTTPATTTSTTTMKMLTGLTPSTLYYVWVRSNCSVADQSSWTALPSFTTVTPPPANDECSTPNAITPGGMFTQNPITATNVGGTNTADATAVHACQSNANKDVWFSVVVPASGNITIETKPVTGSNFTDSVLAVY